MTQDERRIYLIGELLKEQPGYRDIEIPRNERDRRVLLRSLFNVRMPLPVTDEFLEVQDAYLREETEKKGITEWTDLCPIKEDLYLWQGDITTLRCDAIVNAANSGLLGCFCPRHGCIDNAIHTYSGVQLRLDCNNIMQKQGHEEAAGRAKITPGYNLPCRYILHTVGPIIRGSVTKRDEETLASCYCSCMELAVQNNIKSIAFCCISTGEFRFPNDKAAEIAVRTVKKYKEQTQSDIKVIFNVFKNVDYEIYREILG